MSDEWKWDAERQSRYTEPKPGYRIYETDYVFSGTSETRKVEAPEERLCPMSTGLNTACKPSCVAYNGGMCGIISGKGSHPMKGKYCPFIRRACIGTRCSWWGSYGHCIMFEK